jgi:hypothetical protein
MTAGSPPPTSQPQRHAWLWDTLPADCTEVAGYGDVALRAYLDECGLPAPADCDPAVLAVEMPASGDAPCLRRLAAAPPSTGFVAVAVGGGAPDTPKRVPAVVRAMELLAAPLVAARSAATALRVRRRLRPGRPVVAWAPTGDRSRKHGIGSGGWVARRRVPIGWTLTASSRRRPSVVEAAIASAEEGLGTALRRQGATAYESGKLLVDLRTDRGGRYVLRLSAGPCQQPLARSIDAVEAVAAPPAEAEIASRIVLPVAKGECGPVLFALEPIVDGKPPGSMDGDLGEQAFAFLVGLRAGQTDPTASLRPTPLAEQSARFLPFLSEAERAGLHRIAARVEDTVSELRGGIGHGDFWRENLIARGGRLAAVVDWEWAVQDALPLLDLFDLLTVAGRRRTQPTPGIRFTAQLWPGLSAGKIDPSIARYCEATGVPGDREILEALSVAYWLDRASRELLPWWDRPQREGWIERNVREPLAVLVDAGW